MKSKVCVLMATYNGLKYLEPQISSILSQTGVSVDIFIGDDYSTDGTYEFLLEHYSCVKNVFILDRVRKHGCAGKNFYSLMDRVCFSDYNFVAFSDQDDIWYEDKLERSALFLLNSNDCVGVSSCVDAFWPNGKNVFINKAGALKKYDYIFEPAGPGCTYLLTSEFAIELKKFLQTSDEIYHNVFSHDWLIYAHARRRNYGWHIFPFSTLKYRQHSANETGVNRGLKAFLIRMKKLQVGWYLDQVYSVSKSTGSEELLRLFFPKRGRASLLFYKNVFQTRRNIREAILLALFIFFGIVR